MRYLVLLMLLCAFLCSNTLVAMAAEKNTAVKSSSMKVSQPPASTAAAKPVTATPAQNSARDALVNNIGALRTQELRVIVVQQILNEEMTKLDATQKNFCSQYKLDLEKFRKGLYRYDDQQGKFVEIPASEMQQAPTNR